MKIQINQFQEPDVDVYQDGEFIGVINNIYQYTDICLQVMRNKIPNVYFITRNNIQINLDINGISDYNPAGFFDLMEKQLYELLGWK